MGGFVGCWLAGVDDVNLPTPEQLTAHTVCSHSRLHEPQSATFCFAVFTRAQLHIGSHCKSSGKVFRIPQAFRVSHPATPPPHHPLSLLHCDYKAIYGLYKRTVMDPWNGVEETGEKSGSARCGKQSHFSHKAIPFHPPPFPSKVSDWMWVIPAHPFTIEIQLAGLLLFHYNIFFFSFYFESYTSTTPAACVPWPCL